MANRGRRRWPDGPPLRSSRRRKECPSAYRDAQPDGRLGRLPTCPGRFRTVHAMTESQRTSIDEARRVGDAIGVDWNRFDLEQFRAGMDVEYEHGSHDPQTDVTGDDPILTGKIALAHMKEFPDYYERLKRMEAEAERAWAAKKP